MAKYINIVPEMTSNTTPSGVASGTNLGGGCEYYYAFDHTVNTRCFSDSNNAKYYTISYQFETPQRIDAYKIISSNWIGSTPKHIKLTGYNEEGVGTVLDEQNNITWNDDSSFLQQTFNINSTEKYIKYTLYLSDVYNGGLTAIVVRELELLVEAVLSVTTRAATNITAASMQLNGQLVDLGQYNNADCYFQYTDDESFAENVQETTPQNLTTTGEFSDEITGLEAGKTYYFRAVARVVA